MIPHWRAFWKTYRAQKKAGKQQPSDATRRRLLAAGVLATIPLSAARADFNGPTPYIRVVVSITDLRTLPFVGFANYTLVEVLGYYSALDFGGGLFVWDAASVADDDGGLVINPTGHSGAGRWRRLEEGLYVNVLWFGVKVNDVTFDNTTVLRAAIATNRSLAFPDGVIRYTDTIEVQPNTEWVGEAVGTWFVRAALGLEKNMNGTILFLDATPTTIFQRPFMSDMRVSGGVVPNTSSTDANDAFYKLTSFLNEDADPVTGAGPTMREFTAAVHVLPGTRAALKNIRVQLSFDGTLTVNGHYRPYDFITGTYTTPAPVGLGKNADIGVFVDNNPGFSAQRCQFVGYWRIAAACTVVTYGNDRAVPDIFNQQGAEYVKFNDCVLQGMVSYLERGADRFGIISLGSNYIEIPWAVNHPFGLDQTLGLFRGDGSTSTTFTYTGLDRVGGNLRLTGVTPNPTISGLTAGPGQSTVSPSLYTQALSNTDLSGCELSGLNHASFYRSTELPGETLVPSSAIEISGRGLRGFSLTNTKINMIDDVAIHAHDVVNLTIDDGTGFESQAANDVSGVGLRFLASPAATVNTLVSYPAGSTSQVDFDATSNLRFIDWMPSFDHIPGYGKQTRFTNAAGTGVFNPALLLGSVILHPTSNGIFGLLGKRRGIMDDNANVVIYHDPSTGPTAANLTFRLPDDDGVTYVNRGQFLQSGKKWQWTSDDHHFANAAGTDILRVQSTAITASQHTIPLTDGAFDLGIDGHSWRTVVAQRIFMGSATLPYLRAGTGAPEGSVNGTNGSIYLQGGTPGHIYYKATSPTGNTGWVLII